MVVRMMVRSVRLASVRLCRTHSRDGYATTARNHAAILPLLTFAYFSRLRGECNPLYFPSSVPSVSSVVDPTL
jgi:hypothetical protein